jgi:nucleotide-binding universal stress UspA family protein
VIVAANYPGSLTKGTPYLNIGDLVMQAGRPLLIVPPSATTLTARNILVAWKDTREARRAVSDAMPMLQTAERAIVVEITRKKDIAEANESVRDVVRWLRGHGVKAEGMVAPEQGLNAPQLDGIIKTEGADLVVAGAYHRRRFREWALGGVTRKLLLSGNLCTLVSY